MSVPLDYTKREFNNAQAVKMKGEIGRFGIKYLFTQRTNLETCVYDSYLCF